MVNTQYIMDCKNYPRLLFEKLVQNSEQIRQLVTDVFCIE